jgi:hypothetical protein
VPFIKLSGPALYTGTSFGSAYGDGYGRPIAIFTTAGSDVAEVVQGYEEAPMTAGQTKISAPEALGDGEFTVIGIAESPDGFLAVEPEEAPVVAEASSYSVGNYDRNFFLLTWGGTLPGNEIWSCSLKLADADSLAVAQNAVLESIQIPEYTNDFIAPIVKAFHTDSSAGISSQCMLTYCKITHMGVQGKALEPFSTHISEHVFTPTAGGWGGAIYPNQTALAVTLTTAYSRGPAHAGRFYLPLPAWNLGLDGRLTDVSAASTAASASAFIKNLSDMPGVDVPASPGVVVMSRKAGGAVTRKVTGVSVGRVLDTQRRRRNKLDEGYKSSTVDQGAF